MKDFERLFHRAADLGDDSRILEVFNYADELNEAIEAMLRRFDWGV